MQHASAPKAKPIFDLVRYHSLRLGVSLFRGWVASLPPQQLAVQGIR